MPLKFFLSCAILVLFSDCAFAVIDCVWLSLEMALQVIRVTCTFHARFHRVCVHTREAVTITSVSEVARTFVSLHDTNLSRCVVLQVDLGGFWLKQCPGSYIRSPGHEVGLLLPYTY